MKPASNTKNRSRAIHFLAVFLVIILAGETSATAYQFPSKSPHRMYRIFVPASKTKSKTIPATTSSASQAKSLVAKQNATKSLLVLPTGGLKSSEGSGSSETVTITPTFTPNSRYYGDNTAQAIGYTVSNGDEIKSGTITCNLFTDDTFTTPINVDSQTPAKNYWAKCSGAAYESLGVMHDSHHSDDSHEHPVVYAEVIFEIKKLPIKINVSSQHIAYNANIAPHVLSLSGDPLPLPGNPVVLPNGEELETSTATFKYSGISPTVYSESSNAPTASGSYNIIPSNVTIKSPGSISNYDVTYVDGTLTIDPQTPSVTTYTITASTGSNGSISPSGSVIVNDGDTKSFTISPSTGYQVETVTVDGDSLHLIEIGRAHV